MSDPKGFLKHPRQTPPRQPVPERTWNWKEFYQPLGSAELQTQASRCMDCGVPFCQSASGCPVENLIPEFNDLVHQGDWPEALSVLHSTNNFPEFTGKLCPAPCESACVLGINQDPVSIRMIESSIIDRGFEKGWVVPRPAAAKSGRRVAIIGSGPAGMAAAQQLARAGHAVTVFEKADRVGGLLRYGIPDFKMEKWVLDRRVEQLRAEGVEFVTGAEIGGAAHPTARLLEEFDRVCLALGAEEPRELAIPGRELGGIHSAMAYLEEQNRRGFGGAVPPLEHPDALSARGKRVIIIGGGDTGSDCLGTAHRQGCIEAHQLEISSRPPERRAPQTPWPQWPLQLRTSHAHEEGGSRHWSVSTVSFSGEGGHVRRLHARRADSAEEVTLECDLVLLAMGFTGPSRRPSTAALVSELKLDVDARGNFSTDSSYRTSHPRVFAGGDVRRGASLIVWAIREGRDMAAAVDRDLRQMTARA